MSRALSITAFAAVLLAFALPFGAVSSCGGEEVHFTGVQLATFQVAPDSPHPDDLHEQVERNAGTLALFALVLAATGLALALFGRAGCGVCASLGLLDLQVLFWAILFTSDGGGELYEGYWLALLAYAAVALLYLVLGVRSLPARGRSGWGYAGRTAAVLSPTLAFVGLVVVALLDQP